MASKQVKIIFGKKLNEAPNVSLILKLYWALSSGARSATFEPHPGSASGRKLLHHFELINL